jgi:prefoldin subunit 5
MHSKKSSKTHTRSHTPVDPIVVDEAELKRIEDYLENVQVNTDTIEATEEELTRIEEFLKNFKLDSLPETMVKSGKKKGKSRHHTRANTQEAQSEIDAELDTLEFLLKTSNGPETLINTQKDTIGESNQLKLDSKKKAKNKKHSRDNTQEHRTEVTGIMDTKTVADAITDEAELSTSTDIKAPETKKKSSKTRSKTQEVAQADQLLTMNEFLENSNPELDTMSNHPIEVEDKKRSKPGSHKKKGKKSRNHTRSNTQETEQIANGDQLLTMKEFLENSKLDAKLETIDVPHISQSLDRQEDVPTKQTSIAKNKGKNKNHTRQNTLEHTLDNQPDSVEQLENLDQNHEKNPESIGNSTDMEDKSRKNNSPLQSAKQRKANSISESQMQNDLMEYEPEASEFSSPDLKEESSSIPQQTTKKSGKRKSRPGSFKIKTDTVDANQVDFNSPNPTVPETSSLADQNQGKV